MHKKLIYILIIIMFVSGFDLKRDSYNGHINIEKHNINTEDTKQIVLTKLGNPTSYSQNQKQDTWYYIYTHSRHIAFLSPQKILSKTLIVNFNANETVQDVKMIENYAKRPSVSITSNLKKNKFSWKKILSSLQFTTNRGSR